MSESPIEASQERPADLEGIEKTLLPESFFVLQTHFASQISETHGIPLRDSVLRYTSAHSRIFDHPSKGVDDEWESFVAALPEDPDEMAKQIFSAYINKETSSIQEIDPEKITFGCFSHVYKELRNCFILHFGNNDPLGNLAQDRIEARLDDLRNLSYSMRSLEKKDASVQMTSWLLSVDAFNRLMPSEFVENEQIVGLDLAQDNGLWGQFLDKNGNVKTDLAEQLIANAKDPSIPVIDCFPVKLRTAKVPQEVFFKHYL